MLLLTWPIGSPSRGYLFFCNTVTIYYLQKRFDSGNLAATDSARVSESKNGMAKEIASLNRNPFFGWWRRAYGLLVLVALLYLFRMLEELVRRSGGPWQATGGILTVLWLLLLLAHTATQLYRFFKSLLHRKASRLSS
jgi:hypothetical protein